MEDPKGSSCAVYIDSRSSGARHEFAEAFRRFIEGAAFSARLIILCIGTDRATGDSLGPLVGHKLTQTLPPDGNVRVYGTLEAPVHAGNLSETIRRIPVGGSNPFIVAVDASLGKIENVGRITIGKGQVRPGASLNKVLPRVGDVFVTGVVNYLGAMDILVLQNTRLSVVMSMADVISEGILDGLSLINSV